jgi:hypothetical protein
MFEYLYVIISPLFLCVPIGYVVASYITFRMTRERVVSAHWIALFAFGASATSVAFSCVALLSLELLAGYFSSLGLTTEMSRSISFLFVPWIQLCLVLSTGLLMSHTWRSRILLRNKLGVKDLEDLCGLVLQLNRAAKWADEFKEIFSDVPRLLSAFEQANFATVVGLGWGMADRGLASLVSSKHCIRPRALEIGISPKQFEECYSARTRMAHKGERPTLGDALNLLLLLKRILERLCEKKPPDTA